MALSPVRDRQPVKPLDDPALTHLVAGEGNVTQARRPLLEQAEPGREGAEEDWLVGYLMTRMWSHAEDILVPGDGARPIVNVERYVVDSENPHCGSVCV